MESFNIEIKAKCDFHEEIRKILATENAEFIGRDHQIDTYFNVSNGRLKLREGNIENALIHYEREDKTDPKESDFLLYKSENTDLLKELLERSLGVLTVVDKEREIYFIGDVKIHIDEVKSLGNFVEIEVQGHEDSDKNKLLSQCKYFLKLFRIKDENLISYSYSDLILKGAN
jgi:predicted adenylyl cyclase CyaB